MPWAGVLACPCSSTELRHGQRSTAAHGTRLTLASTTRGAANGVVVHWGVLTLIAIAAVFAGSNGCDRRDAVGRAATTAPSTQPGHKTVASLVPAATDLLLAMGAGDRLVAVSNYDVPRPGVRGLPRVGDYQTTDWEQVRALRPAVMVRQFAPDRVPAGLRERTDALGIRLVNLQIETVNDVYHATEVLGDAIDDPAAGRVLADRLRGQLDAVRARTAGGSRPSVLIVRDTRGEEVIGPDTFLDDLVTIAGGRNAAAGLGKRYPTIDRELLRSIDPDVILQLLPDATPQVLEQARQTWKGLPALKAVKGGRVYPITDWYGLLPGAHLGELAEKFAAAIHPETPATQPVALETGGRCVLYCGVTDLSASVAGQAFLGVHLLASPRRRDVVRVHPRRAGCAGRSPRSAPPAGTAGPTTVGLVALVSQVSECPGKPVPPFESAAFLFPPSTP